MHSRKDRILELQFDMDRLAILVHRWGDVEHVQGHRDVDEQRGVRIVPSRADSGRGTISMQIRVLSQGRAISTFCRTRMQSARGRTRLGLVLHRAGNALA